MHADNRWQYHDDLRVLYNQRTRKRANLRRAGVRQKAKERTMDYRSNTWDINASTWELQEANRRAGQTTFIADLRTSLQEEEEEGFLDDDVAVDDLDLVQATRNIRRHIVLEAPAMQHLTVTPQELMGEAQDDEIRQILHNEAHNIHSLIDVEYDDNGNVLQGCDVEEAVLAPGILDNVDVSVVRREFMKFLVEPALKARELKSYRVSE